MSEASAIVTCGACAHFRASDTDIEHGMGVCELKAWPHSIGFDPVGHAPPPWPLVERLCKSWEGVPA